MSAGVPMLDECFSEAPLKPRCLNFSESPSSHCQHEENKMKEAPTKLLQSLSKAFLTMIGQKARFDLQMQVTKAKVEALNGDAGGELIVPHDISGDLTIVRFFNHQPSSTTTMNQHPVSCFRRIINKDIEASINAPPNNSSASNMDDANITVTEEMEDSDYVSTLRDVDEDE